MKTKARLEMIAGYLAGREGEQAEAIRLELGDPSSEASRFLGELRRKTSGMLDAPMLDGLGLPRSRSRSRFRSPRAGPARRPVVGGWARAGGPWVAALLLAALTVGLASLAYRGDLRRIEATLARRDAALRDALRRLESAADRPAVAVGPPAPKKDEPPAPPIPTPAPAAADDGVRLALNRVESRLEAIERQVGATRTPPPDDAQAAGAIAALRAEIDRLRKDLARLRKDLEGEAGAGRRDRDEIRMALRNALQWLETLVNRAPVQVPVPIPVPVPNFPGMPVPGQGQPSNPMPKG